MSRLSFRPRPLDIHKKLPIVKSVKELEDDETPTSTRNSQLLRFAAEVDNEVLNCIYLTWCFPSSHVFLDQSKVFPLI